MAKRNVHPVREDGRLNPATFLRRHLYADVGSLIVFLRYLGKEANVTAGMKGDPGLLQRRLLERLGHFFVEQNAFAVQKYF